MHALLPKHNPNNPAAAKVTPWWGFYPEGYVVDAASSKVSLAQLGLHGSLPLPLAIMDSGVGGLAVAAALNRLAPQVPLVYVADTAWMPYGDKSLDDLKLRVRHVYQGLQRCFGTQHLVLACNSASASLPLPVTLPAADTPHVLPPLVDIISTTVAYTGAWARQFLSTQGRVPRVALMATVATQRSHRYDDWLAYTETPCELISVACPGLATAIEHQEDTLEATLHHALEPVLRWQPDAVILGCTHYLLVASRFAEVLGPTTRLINPAQVIAERLVAGCAGSLASEGQAAQGPVCLLTTASSATAMRVLSPWYEHVLATP
jgi:glutamate racemase